MTRPIIQVPLTASPGEILKACAELILKCGPYYPAGICLNLTLEMSSWMQSNETSSVKLRAPCLAVMELFKHLSRLWPHFSGDHLFPVPWPDRSLEPQEAYDREDKWEGEYGDLRRNLLEFVRDHATGVLEEARTASLRREYSVAAREKSTEHPVSTIILNSYKETPSE